MISTKFGNGKLYKNFSKNFSFDIHATPSNNHFNWRPARFRIPSQRACAMNAYHERTSAPIYTCTHVRFHPCHTSMRITIHGVGACAVPITFSCSAVVSDVRDTDDTRTVTLCANFPAFYFKKLFVSTLAWNCKTTKAECYWRFKKNSLSQRKSKCFWTKLTHKGKKVKCTREVNWGATWTESSGSGPENRD